MFGAVPRGDEPQPIICLLLARGADPNLKSAQGETAADWASKVGAPAGIELLHSKSVGGRLTMCRTASFPVDVLYQRMDIRVPEIVTYQLAGMAASEFPPDRMTDASAVNTAVQQSADGAWLQQATPVTAEDRNMQLLGFYWAGAGAPALQPFARAILATQQADGGWRIALCPRKVRCHGARAGDRTFPGR